MIIQRAIQNPTRRIDLRRVKPGKGGGSVPTFNGKAYDPAGNITENLTDASKPWVKYDIATGIITQEIGPPASPWGANETWRKKSDFTGSIYF